MKHRTALLRTFGIAAALLAAAAPHAADGARRQGSVPRLHFPAQQVAAADSTRIPLRRPRTARLVFAGDLMQHLPQVEAARRADGTFDYGRTFEAVAPLFADADLAAINLETTLTDSDRHTGNPCFRSPAALADALRACGIDVCVLANNHCCDGGTEGIRTTLRTLDRAGIGRTGVFADSCDLRRHHPLRLRAGEVEVALLDYTYGTNGIPVPHGALVNRIDTAAMRRDLHRARSEGADVVAVCIHWGEEYARRENAAQRRTAAWLRRHGADLVIGSHPHVVQPYRADSAGAVFYSLGNFVSNQRRRYCDGGIVAVIDVVCRDGQRPLFRAGTVPVWVLLPGYRVLPGPVADTLRMSPAARRAYERFAADTHEILSAATNAE